MHLFLNVAYVQSVTVFILALFLDSDPPTVFPCNYHQQK